MKTVDKNTNSLIIKFKPQIEIVQAIANLSRQNTHGQYDERIKVYAAVLEKYKSTLKNNVVAAYKATTEEAAAIMLFNKDKRFTITE